MEYTAVSTTSEEMKGGKEARKKEGKKRCRPFVFNALEWCRSDEYKIKI